MPSQVMWQEAVRRAIEDAEQARSEVAGIREGRVSDLMDSLAAAETELGKLVDVLSSPEVMDAQPGDWERIQDELAWRFMNGDVGRVAANANWFAKQLEDRVYDVAFYPVRDRLRELGRCVGE